MAEKAVKCRCAALCGFTFRITVLFSALFRLLIIHKSLICRTQFLFTGNLFIQTIKLCFGLIPLRTLFFGHNTVTDLFMDCTHFGGDGITFLF